MLKTPLSLQESKGEEAQNIEQERPRALLSKKMIRNNGPEWII